MARTLTEPEASIELHNNVKKLRLKQGDICVLTGAFTVPQIRALCTIKDIPRVPVLVLANGQSIEALDEAQMKRLGWVRAVA